MRISARLRIASVLALLGCAWSLAIAEVSTDRVNSRRVSTLMMDRVVSITDGADPIPNLRWNPYRRIDPRRLLNPSGAVRHDGRPDVVFHPVAGWPFVTWAYNNGTDHDIAFSHWNGLSWSETEFLTFDLENQVDPRMFVSERGQIHVVWAVRGPDPRIMVTSRHIDDDFWTGPLRLTAPGEPVARPTVTAKTGVAWIAYERRTNLDGTAHPMVVLRRVRTNDTGFHVETFPSQRSEDLDPILHVNHGTVWMDWKFSDDLFAWVVLEGPDAGVVRTMPWTDRSWIGIESVRRMIQTRAMGVRPAMNTVGDDGAP